MVGNITSLTGNGLKDWLIQRLSSLYFALYVFFLVGYFVLYSPIYYLHWAALFHNPWFQVASLLAILSFFLHAWIGLWTVITDYVKCSLLRLALEMSVLIILLSEFIWFVMIIWG